MSPPGALSPWFNKYIFPGGYSPAFSEVIPAVENSGLVSADLEIWRGQYERMLRDWLELFEGNADKIRAMFDARFVRMWRYCLVAASVSFPEIRDVVFQLQLSKDMYRVSGSRDYIYEETHTGIADRARTA